MTPLVSIIIVNWNAKDYLEQCINSLLSQTLSDFEIILVDNNSTDNSLELIEKKYTQIKLIKNNENVGFAEGNNVGIKHAKGKYIALFNPDAVAEKKWLSHLISVLDSSDRIAAVTGKMYYLDDKYGKDAVFCTWSKIDPYSANPYNFSGNEPMSKVDYVSGAAMVFKRSVIDTVGLLDREYFLYFEETDWCARMIRAGYDLIYVPNAIVWHAVSPLSSSSNKIYYMERSRLRFAIKNFDANYLLYFFGIFFLESSGIFGRDLKNRNFERTQIRFRAIMWNLTNFFKTIRIRKKHIKIIKSHTEIKSYNNSLPLKDIHHAGIGDQ